MSGYPFAQMRADLRADLEAYLDFAAHYAADRRTFGKHASALLTPSGLACLFHRLSHYAYRRGLTGCAAALAWANLLATRVSIAPPSRIGGGLYIPHPSTGIVFQGTAGRNLRLFAGSGVMARYLPLHWGPLEGAPHLGDDVSVGAKAIIRGAVRVGSNVRVGFDVLVERDLPGNCAVFSGTLKTRVVR